MSRKPGWVEALAAAAMVTGAGPAAAVAPEEGRPPEGVDYLMAMQCAALNLAHYDITLNTASLINGRQYQTWAGELALKSNPASIGAAEKDIAASKADVLSGVAQGEAAARRVEMETRHAAELKVCDSFIDNAVIHVIIGG